MIDLDLPMTRAAVREHLLAGPRALATAMVRAHAADQLTTRRRPDADLTIGGGATPGGTVPAAYLGGAK